MNDILSDLIKTVFDKLESLDEKEFNENLSKYYDDPLTELLSQSNKFKDNSYESPHIPFLSDDINVYESVIFEPKILSAWELTSKDCFSVYLNNYNPSDSSFLTYSQKSMYGINNNLSAITSASIKATERIADNYDSSDEDCGWAKAA